MATFIRNVVNALHHHSIFDAYYTSVVKAGATGVPTADEARRDLERRQITFMRLGGL